MKKQQENKIPRNRAVPIGTGTGIGGIEAAVEILTDLPVIAVPAHEHYDHVAGARRFEEIYQYNKA